MDEKEEEAMESIERIFQSEHLTLQMAIPYLYQYRTHKRLTPIILESLKTFPTNQLTSWLPMVVYIYRECKSALIESFLHELAVRSIPTYLMIRWSLATFIPAANYEDLEIACNKLDAKFINKLSASNKKIQEITPEDIGDIIAKKQALSNYTSVLNNFYEKLFRLPEKLRDYPEPQRKQELQSRLDRLLTRFTSRQQARYCCGACLPLCSSDNSYLLMNFNKEQCRPFSTRQRIPFRMVFETINFADYDKVQSETELVSKITSTPATSPSLLLPHTYFGEEWVQASQKMRRDSAYGHLGSYQVHAYIVKSGDDLRQEYLAMQLIKMLEKIFEDEHLKLWVQPYQIIPFSADSGLIEFISDTQTISALKAASSQRSLRTIYKQIYGENWETAITNFIRSLAGYSLFQYLFQVKDRHNNNILIDRMGHSIHIDFSFIICSSPGNLGFEKAPFKFTYDYVELMEGLESDIAQHFKFLLATGLKYVRKYKKEIMGVLSVMKDCPQMKCFQNYDPAQIERRFHDSATDEELERIVDGLVRQAYNSYSTSSYDRYQWLTNEIHS